MKEKKKWNPMAWVLALVLSAVLTGIGTQTVLSEQGAPVWALVGVVLFVVLGLVFTLALGGKKTNAPVDEASRLHVTLEAEDLAKTAGVILEGLGGKSNVKTLSNSADRLKLEVNDYTGVDERKIKSAGVAGVIRPSKTAVQIMVGPRAQELADELKKLI